MEFKFTPSPIIYTGIGENFPKLTNLWIRNQYIKYVERENFAGLTNLEVLNLKNNKIEFLPEDVFSDLSNLEELLIHVNRIKHFPANIFEKLTKIERILTYENSATTIGIDFRGIGAVQLYNESYYHYYKSNTKLIRYIGTCGTQME